MPGHDVLWRRPTHQSHKPTIAITFTDDASPRKPIIYTTLDRITGIATITLPSTHHLSTLSITLEGFAATCITRNAANGRGYVPVITKLPFLKLIQPIPSIPSAVQNSSTSSGGDSRHIAIPFTFVIPTQLLPSACKHGRHWDDGVREAHLDLPPSFGGSNVWGEDRVTRLEDMASRTGVVNYIVCVEATISCVAGGLEEEISVEERRKVTVIPVRRQEIPPAPVCLVGGEVKNKINELELSGPCGRLRVEPEGPINLRLQLPRSGTVIAPVVTTTTLILRFFPKNKDVQPPKLGTLATKLRACTFYSDKLMTELPRLDGLMKHTSVRVHIEDVPLVVRPLESVSWVKEGNLSASAKPNGGGMSSPPTPWSISSSLSSSSPAQFSYKTTILLPITLPTHSHVFVPTFYSCLIARTYSLDLKLTVGKARGIPRKAAMSLELPLQISVGSSSTVRGSEQAAKEAASNARDEAFFVPQRECISETEEEDDHLADHLSRRRVSKGQAPPTYERLSSVEAVGSVAEDM